MIECFVLMCHIVWKPVLISFPPSTFFIAWHTEKVLTLSRHTTRFLTIGKAHLVHCWPGSANAPGRQAGTASLALQKPFNNTSHFHWKTKGGGMLSKAVCHQMNQRGWHWCGGWQFRVLSPRQQMGHLHNCRRLTSPNGPTYK